MMKTIDKRLFRMIKRTRGQFIAVLLVMALGVAIYLSLMASASDIENNLDSFYTFTNYADLYAGVDRISARKAQDLKSFAGVTQVEGRVHATVPMLDAGGLERGKVRLITFSGKPDGINRPLLLEGAMPAPGKAEILLIRHMAEAGDIRPGDSMTLQVSGRQVSFRVSGIAASSEFVYLIDPNEGIYPDNASYGIAYVNEGLGQDLMGFSGGYNQILMKIAPGMSDDAQKDLMEEIDEYLAPYGVRETYKGEDLLSYIVLDTQNQFLMQLAQYLMPVCMLAVAIELAMIVDRLVKKDRQPIGVMKSMGYTSAQIIRHYTKYALIISLFGIVLGTLIGLFMSGKIVEALSIYFVLPQLGHYVALEHIIPVCSIATIVAVIGGLIGSRTILKIDPAESMKAEPPKIGRKIFLERVGLVWRHLSFSWKLTAKNLFRNVKRSSFVFMGVAITHGTILIIITLYTTRYSTVAQGLVEFLPMDYAVSFRYPVTELAANEIRQTLDGPIEIESVAEYPFKLVNGNKEMNLTVTGVKPNTEFYHFKTRDGRPLTLPESGVFINGLVAKRLGVDVGDKILLKSWNQNDGDLWAEVAGVNFQAVGVGCYINRETLSEKYLGAGFITGFLINTNDPDAKSKLMDIPGVSAVLSMTSTLESFYVNTASSRYAIIVQLILVALLGFTVVYNATIIAVGERKGEFSTLMVLGFSSSEIFRIVLRENNIVGFCGIMFGWRVGTLILGYLSDKLDTEKFSLYIHASTTDNLAAFAFTISFIVCAQLATRRKIRNLAFLEALKERV